jgi:branched-chain amino acid transport system ATP-binding protein
MALLELNAVARYFGGVKAVDGLDLKVEQGAVFGLIGPNGSGKSTTVNLITGVYGLSAGSVQFDGQDISETPIHRRLGLGISRTFQNIRLFGRLTVWQNLWVAQNSQADQRRQRFLGCWSSQAWRTKPMSWPPISRSETSASSNSRGPCLPIPSSFCWTSLPRE